MNHLIKIATLATLVALSQNSLAGTISDTFTSGDALTATKINSIKSAVNDNDAKLTTQSNDITDINTSLSTMSNQLQEVSENLQRSVAINCDANADAFINTNIANNTTYILTGVCNGPIEINGRSNITITGDANGVKDDGISLVANVVSAYPAALFADRTQNLVLKNLIITAYNSLSPSADASAKQITAMYFGRISSVSIYNVSINGGDAGLVVYDGATLRMYEGNSVLGFLDTGISIIRNSVLGIRAPISVIGGTTVTTTSVPNTIVASQNSTIRISSSGHTFTPSPSANNGDAFSLNAKSNSIIEVNNAVLNGDVTTDIGSYIKIYKSVLNGNVLSKQNSVINILATTIDGDIKTETSSTLSIDDSTVTNGVFDAKSNSNIFLHNSTQSNGSFNIKQGSNLDIILSNIGFIPGGFNIATGATVTIDNITITQGDNITMNSFATFTHAGALNSVASTMNGVNITCQYPEQYNDNGMALINLGTVSCP